MQNDTPTHDTDCRMTSLKLFVTVMGVQVVPSHVAADPPPDCAVPAAPTNMQKVDVVQETPKPNASVAVSGSDTGVGAQMDPFHCSTKTEPMVMPAAMQK